MAITLLKTEIGCINTVYKKLMEIPQIISLFTLSGVEYDILAIIKDINSENLESVLYDKIKRIKGIIKIWTMQVDKFEIKK